MSSVWYGCVLRGDINSIVIGEGTNVQDGTIVHLADDYGVRIGNYTTIGHAAIIHACEIGNECLIGMGATVLDGARIGDRCIVGANALVTQRFVAPPGSMILGAPAKVVRLLTEQEVRGLRAVGGEIRRGREGARGAAQRCVTPHSDSSARAWRVRTPHSGGRCHLTCSTLELQMGRAVPPCRSSVKNV